MVKGVVKGAFTGWFELKAQSRRAGKSACNTPACRNTVKESTRRERARVHLTHLRSLHRKTAENEQNLEVIQGELQLEFIELLKVQTPPVAGRTFAPGGHPQTAGNRGNADEEARLPGEEDRAGDYDSQEEWHQKQAGYV